LAVVCTISSLNKLEPKDGGYQIVFLVIPELQFALYPPQY